MTLALQILLAMMANAATPRFRCFAVPYEMGTWSLQVAEYSSLCPSDRTEVDLSSTAVRDVSILCFYNAFCTADPNQTMPSNPSGMDIRAEFMRPIPGFLPSRLVCKGTGRVNNRRLIAQSCPPPSECQDRDVIFNTIPVGVMPAIPERADVAPKKTQGER